MGVATVLTHQDVECRLRRRIPFASRSQIEDGAAEGLAEFYGYWWPRYGRRYGSHTRHLGLKFAVDRGQVWVQAELDRSGREAHAMDMATNRAAVPKDGMARVVDCYIETMPELERAVFEGIYWESLSERDMADRLGVTRAKVRSIHDQGLRRMGMAMVAWRAGFGG